MSAQGFRVYGSGFRVFGFGSLLSFVGKLGGRFQEMLEFGGFLGGVSFQLGAGGPYRHATCCWDPWTS